MTVGQLLSVHPTQRSQTWPTLGKLARERPCELRETQGKSVEKARSPRRRRGGDSPSRTRVRMRGGPQTTGNLTPGPDLGAYVHVLPTISCFSGFQLQASAPSSLFVLRPILCSLGMSRLPPCKILTQQTRTCAVPDCRLVDLPWPCTSKRVCNFLNHTLLFRIALTIILPLSHQGYNTKEATLRDFKLQHGGYPDTK